MHKELHMSTPTCWGWLRVSCWKRTNLEAVNILSHSQLILNTLKELILLITHALKLRLEHLECLIFPRLELHLELEHVKGSLCINKLLHFYPARFKSV